MAFTYFFRDMQTLELIREHAMPELKGRKFIDIWDAGCAMGPEPYSLAIMLRESMGRFMFRNVRLFATDIDSSNLFEKIIADGVYPFEQVRRIPGEILGKYFEPLPDDPQSYVIREDVRACIHYQQHDLLTLDPIRKSFGLIVCKNVLLHFQHNERVRVYEMFHDALSDGGFLVNEQTQVLPDEVSHLFSPVVPNARIYRKTVVGS